MGVNVGHAYDGKKPKVVTDMYRSTEVKGEGIMAKIHGTPKKGGGKKNQYGENRTIAGR